MKTRAHSAKLIASLEQDALELIIPHFASNAELAKGPKIFARGEGCYVYDIHGTKYFDSFATLLTTVCGYCRPEVTHAVAEQSCNVAKIASEGAAAGELDAHMGVSFVIEKLPFGDGCPAHIGKLVRCVNPLRIAPLKILQKWRQGQLGFV